MMQSIAVRNLLEVAGAKALPMGTEAASAGSKFSLGNVASGPGCPEDFKIWTRRHHWQARIEFLTVGGRQGEANMDKATEALEELLNDPMIRLVMASDGVEPDEVRSLFVAGQEEDDGEAELPASHLIASSCCGEGMCCI